MRIHPVQAKCLVIERTGQGVFLSIAAGRTVASFEAVLGDDARIVRAMPNTPAAVGRGITVLIGNGHVTTAQRDACEALMTAVGKVDKVAIRALLTHNKA